MVSGRGKDWGKQISRGIREYQFVRRAMQELNVCRKIRKDNIYGVTKGDIR